MATLPARLNQKKEAIIILDGIGNRRSKAVKGGAYA
jgi:hypothetical protein